MFLELDRGSGDKRWILGGFHDSLASICHSSTKAREAVGLWVMVRIWREVSRIKDFDWL